MLPILVIGAGLAGLACARALTAAGRAVIVIDKGRGAGGRMTTRRFGADASATGASAFDTGAQFATVRDARFQAVLDASGLATRWSDGFPALFPGESTPRVDADGHPRFRIAGGMKQLAHFLAQSLQIRDQHTVTALTPHADAWRVTVTPGDLAPANAQPTGPNETLTAAAVVLTAPVPQALHLLDAAGLAVDPRLRAVRYDPCLCLLLDCPDATAPLLPAPGGLRLMDDPVLSWMASQRAKGLRTHGDGLVVHATGAWSAAHGDATDADILAALRAATDAVLARLNVRVLVADQQLKRWRFSLPTVTFPAAFFRVPAPAPLLLAGDAFGPHARLEQAWLSGVAAAEALLE